MIYLREANVLFLKARKVAGTSFEIALSKFAKQDDIITPISHDDERIRTDLGFPGPQNYLKTIWEFSAADIYKLARYRSYPQKFSNHISAVEARKGLGAEVFDNAYKVAIVRNPYDMLVSYYFFEMSFTKNKTPFTDWIRRNPHVLNSNDQQYDVDGKNVIDCFIRFEMIGDDTAKLEKEKAELTGLSDLLGSIRTKNRTRPPENTTPPEMFGEHSDLISAVHFFNKRIMDRFEYSLD